MDFFQEMSFECWEGVLPCDTSRTPQNIDFFATLVSEICCTLSMYSLCYNLQPQKMETILRLLFLIWKKNIFLGISISWYGGKGVTKKCPKDISTFLAKKDNLCLALWKRLLFTLFYQLASTVGCRCNFFIGKLQ